MSRPWPNKSAVYIPSLSKLEEVTEEDIKAGELVAVSEDGTTGLAEVKKGLVVSYVRVLIGPDGRITGSAPYRANRYCRVVPASGTAETG